MEKVESLTERLAKSARAVKVEDIAIEIERQMRRQSVVAIYQERILAQRTRQYELKTGGKDLRVEVLHTLLGIELKIGNRRLLCPDLATARYLAVFARLGCDLVAIPYDITQISTLADELESSWQRMMLLAEHFARDRGARLLARVKRKLVADWRAQILQLGAGAKVPQFTQKTRQRS